MGIGYTKQSDRIAQRDNHRIGRQSLAARINILDVVSNEELLLGLPNLLDADLEDFNDGKFKLFGVLLTLVSSGLLFAELNAIDCQDEVAKKLEQFIGIANLNVL